MATESTRSAQSERLDGTCVTGQNGIAIPLQIVLAMPTQNIGDSGHGAAGD